MTRVDIETIIADFHAGRADRDPFDEIQALITELRRCEGDLAVAVAETFRLRALLDAATRSEREKRQATLDRLMASSEKRPAPAHVPKELGECLVWTGTLDQKGYGRLFLIRDGHRKGYLVHRLAWAARHGEPPADTPNVLHHCDNPPCWADKHLWVGTHADNAADRESKGRGNHLRNGNHKKTHCPNGHEYAGENLYVDQSGYRVCRTCRRDQSVIKNARRRAAGRQP